jgi:hypothetical protein
MPDESENEELRRREAQRAREEARLADQPATTDDERRAHERRSDKAEYLREKLEEQAEAPDE